MAHTGAEVNICFQGTCFGFFFDDELPIAVSISSRSFFEILGCLAGVSYINVNQNIDHMKPTPPIQIIIKQKIVTVIQ